MVRFSVMSGLHNPRFGRPPDNRGSQPQIPALEPTPDFLVAVRSMIQEVYQNKCRRLLSACYKFSTQPIMNYPDFMELSFIFVSQISLLFSTAMDIAKTQNLKTNPIKQFPALFANNVSDANRKNWVHFPLLGAHSISCGQNKTFELALDSIGDRISDALVQNADVFPNRFTHVNNGTTCASPLNTAITQFGSAVCYPPDLHKFIVSLLGSFKEIPNKDISILLYTIINLLLLLEISIKSHLLPHLMNQQELEHLWQVARHAIRIAFQYLHTKCNFRLRNMPFPMKLNPAQTRTFDVMCLFGETGSKPFYRCGNIIIELAKSFATSQTLNVNGVPPMALEASAFNFDSSSTKPYPPTSVWGQPPKPTLAKPVVNSDGWTKMPPTGTSFRTKDTKEADETKVADTNPFAALGDSTPSGKISKPTQKHTPVPALSEIKALIDSHTEHMTKKTDDICSKMLVKSDQEEQRISALMVHTDETVKRLENMHTESLNQIALLCDTLKAKSVELDDVKQSKAELHSKLTEIAASLSACADSMKEVNSNLANFDQTYSDLLKEAVTTIMEAAAQFRLSNDKSSRAIGAACQNVACDATRVVEKLGKIVSQFKDRSVADSSACLEILNKLLDVNSSSSSRIVLLADFVSALLPEKLYMSKQIQTFIENNSADDLFKNIVSKFTKNAGWSDENLHDARASIESAHSSIQELLNHSINDKPKMPPPEPEPPKTADRVPIAIVDSGATSDICNPGSAVTKPEEGQS